MHLSRHLKQTSFIRLVMLCLLCVGASSGPNELFDKGVKAYAAGEYTSAAEAFRTSAGKRPSTGALQNLGNAEWQLGRTGQAVLAWERALWLDAYNGAARQNLKFARWTAQLESPDFSWYEVISTWLPVNWWSWIAGVTLWGSVWIVVMPAILRRGKSWNQATAAFGLMIFLLSLPALLGVSTRSRLGFVLERDTPLLLTPTRDGQAITRLAAGDPARLDRFRGDFALVRVARSKGWIEKSRLGLVCPENAKGTESPVHQNRLADRKTSALRAVTRGTALVQ
jgi:hypothetical protein